MPERVQHPYECTAKGHQGGSRTFLAAPPEWYDGKGISTPKNCPDCRKWVKAQTDERKRCASCGTEFRITANAKISYFKKDGPYVPVTECGRCQDGQRPEKGIKKRPAKPQKEEKKEEKQPGSFSELNHGIAPQPRRLIMSGSYYDKVVPSKSGGTEIRRVHLEHHIPGSSHDWTTKKAAESQGLGRPDSPSIFAAGVRSWTEMLNNAAPSMLRADDNAVREYVIHQRRIVRVTYSGDHNGLELTFLDATPGGYGVASSHDNVDVAYVMHQTWYNKG